MICLVDYENVPNTGLVGIDKLTANDKVIILLKENNTFSAKTHINLEKATVKKEYLFVNATSKNALDFQLVAYLSLLCAKAPKDEQFYIISKDQGFDAAIKFLKGRGYSVARKTDLAMNSTLADLKKLLPDYTDAQRDTISNIIENYKTKMAINNNLNKVFGSEIAGAIYKKIKPLLKDKS